MVPQRVGYSQCVPKYPLSNKTKSPPHIHYVILLISRTLHLLPTSSPMPPIPIYSRLTHANSTPHQSHLTNSIHIHSSNHPWTLLITTIPQFVHPYYTSFPVRRRTKRAKFTTSYARKEVLLHNLAFVRESTKYTRKTTGQRKGEVR